jgi:hypothetical protein
VKVRLSWYRLRWPREVTPEQVTQALRLLTTTAGTPLVLEAVGCKGVVTHHLALPSGNAGGVVRQLRASIPGLYIEANHERPMRRADRAVELRLSTRRRALRTDDPAAVSRALLSALAHVGKGEAVGVQWVLRRPLLPLAVSSEQVAWSRESWLGSLLVAPFAPPRAPDHELRSAVRAKQAEPGWRAVGRLAVKADGGSRQRQLIHQVLGALRSSEAASVGFRVRAAATARFERAAKGWRAPLALNVLEVSALSGWPIGQTADLPVDMIPFRLVAPSPSIPCQGRVIGEATFPGHRRPLALGVSDSRRHIHILGPTGTGKSTLLAALIVHSMRAGRAVVVIEPKGDLIADVLARVPAERVRDVVLLDPTDTQRPVGLNPLSRSGRSPELVADQLLGICHALHSQHWGPRTHDILGASLLTLARTSNATLAALPVLLTDAGFRRRIVARIDDPMGLEPFWSAFEAWSEPERTTAIAPTLNKLRPLLLRPEVRNIIGQAKPAFDMRQVFTERKILLVNLAKGQLGPETATLLGSLVVSLLWQAILGRSAIPPERRATAMVYVDEFQEYLQLPTDFADALTEARGLGVSFALAHQYLHQLGPEMRSAVLANAQSRVAFRLPAEDARVIAAGGALEAEDFQGLGAFQCYAQLVAQNTVQPWCSAATLPLAEPISNPKAVAEASRQAYGTPRQQVEAELHKLFLPRLSTDAGDDLGPRRRDIGGRP